MLHITIEAGEERIILHATSGLRNMGVGLMKRDFKHGQGIAYILINHAHMGSHSRLSFFKPKFVRGNRITICSPFPEMALDICNQKKPEYFPISTSDRSN